MVYFDFDFRTDPISIGCSFHATFDAHKKCYFRNFGITNGNRAFHTNSQLFHFRHSNSRKHTFVIYDGVDHYVNYRQNNAEITFFLGNYFGKQNQFDGDANHTAFFPELGDKVAPFFETLKNLCEFHAT